MYGEELVADRSEGVLKEGRAKQMKVPLHKPAKTQLHSPREPACECQPNEPNVVISSLNGLVGYFSGWHESCSLVLRVSQPPLTRNERGSCRLLHESVYTCIEYSRELSPLEGNVKSCISGQK